MSAIGRQHRIAIAVLWLMCLTALLTPCAALAQTADGSNLEILNLSRDGDPKTGSSRQNSPLLSAANLIFSLAVVLSLIFLLRWAAQRFMGLQVSGGGGAVQVLSRTVLSPRQQLILLQVGRRVVLVANNGSSANTLCEVRDPDEIAEIVSQSKQPARRRDPMSSFRTFFSKAGQVFESPAEAERQTEAVESDPAGLHDVRTELGGLRERVRTLSQSFRK